MRIPVTRNFDTTQPIGYLTLRDDVDILPDFEFALSYIVQEKTSDGRATKIQVQSVSLVPKSNYLRYVQREQEERMASETPANGAEEQ